MLNDDELYGDGLTRNPRIDPPAVRKILKNIGNEQVQSLKLVRTPLSSSTKFLLNVASFGQLKDKLKEADIDELFHLRMIINDKYSLEKNEVIRLYNSNKIESGSQVLPVNVSGQITIQQMLDKTKEQMGDLYGPYNAQTNNCGDFLYSVLNANGLITQEITNFTKQQTEKLFSKFPSLSKMLVNLGTEAGAVASRLIEGEGKGDKYAVLEEEKSILDEKEAQKKLNELRDLPDYPKFKEKYSDSEVKLIAKYDKLVAYFNRLGRYGKTLPPTNPEKGLINAILFTYNRLIDRKVPSESEIVGRGHCQCGGQEITEIDTRDPRQVRLNDLVNRIIPSLQEQLQDVLGMMFMEMGNINFINQSQELLTRINEFIRERDNLRTQLSITEDTMSGDITENTMSGDITEDTMSEDITEQRGGMEPEFEPTNPDIERVSSLRRSADRLYADIKNIVNTGNVMAFAGGLPQIELMNLRDMKNRYNLLIGQIEAITGETEERKVLPTLIYQTELSGSGQQGNGHSYKIYNNQLPECKIKF